MQFESHHMIWLFWLLPVCFLCFLYFEQKRRRILYRFLEKQELKKRLPDYSPLASYLHIVFFLFTLFFLCLALLKPYSGYELKEIKREGIDIYFLVDLSPSMKAQDVKPDRLTRAKYELQDFLKLLTGDRVGLIGFSGEAFVFVPLTTDYNAFSLFLQELDSNLIPAAGTDIYSAVKTAVESFQKQPSSEKTIILITDGEDSVGLTESMIADIKALDVKVFIVGIGTQEGAPIPSEDGQYKKDNGKIVLSKLDEQGLQNLALATGGGYIQSTGGHLDLEKIYYQGIKKSIQKTETGTMQKKLPNYKFQVFLILALLFLTLEMLTTNKKRFWLKVFKLSK